jgi:hypothetical protein
MDQNPYQSPTVSSKSPSKPPDGLPTSAFLLIVLAVVALSALVVVGWFAARFL